MTCTTDAELNRLRTDDTFIDWILKLKDAYPEKSDEDVEKMLVTFMNVNNGNFPGYTPFGDRSETFDGLLKVYGGDEVSAMLVYEHLFTKEFIKEFGDWCGMNEMDKEDLTEEEAKKLDEENQTKLLHAVRNTLGEPALLFVDSVSHKAVDTAVAATNVIDRNIPFKVTVENGEARAIVGFDGPVQSGSITFVVSKHVNYPISSSDKVYIDTEDIDKTYDFNSENKGFTEKRLGVFTTQSSKDLYYISSKISKANGLLFISYRDIHSREDAINYLKNNERTLGLVFDTDELSPFGSIQLMPVPYLGSTAWLIVSPEGIFCGENRYKVHGQTMTAKSQTYVDKLAELFFVNSSQLKTLKDYIISNIVVVKPDSYLSSSMVDYEDDHFILKPSSNRTQHNVKTEFGLSYAVQLFNKDQEKFKKYLDIAKLFSEIRQNSPGAGSIKDVNMVGNLIGAILSGLLIDDNYYLSHSFDLSAIEQAIFVSRHLTAIRGIVEDLWKDITKDTSTSRVLFLVLRSIDRNTMFSISEMYKKTNFSNVADNIVMKREMSKLNEDDVSFGFCDSIDKVKAAYTYRRNDSGSKKQYDATEYTKLSATCEYLNRLNKQIKEYLINRDNSNDLVQPENIEKLISLYFTSINTIISIMDDDISRLEGFVRYTPEKYTPDYYQLLLYFDRSIIKMYKEQKETIEKIFKLDSESSGLVQKALYDVFNLLQIRTFKDLRSRFYDNYSKLSTLKQINGEESSLEEIIHTMIEDAIDHICDDWCNKNLRCLTEREEKAYRENLKLDLEGHINAGMPLDTAIGGASSSGHSIINVLYRIILTLGLRSNLLIKQKGDELLTLFKDTFGSRSPFNQCKLFCEIVEETDKTWVTRKPRKVTSGYFIRPVNYGQYYRAKVVEQRRLLDKLPKNSNGERYYTIDELKSTKTKLVIEWGVGSEKYQNLFLDDMDKWIERNANRRYNAKYYIERRRILGQERNGIVVGNEAANRQNTLRRLIDGIKNRYRDKKSGVFLPFKVPPVLRLILLNLEQQLADLSSPYERYIDSEGTPSIREKSGLDLAIALNIQEWNKFIQKKRTYSQDAERYNEVEKDLKSRIGKDITKEDYDAFVLYYHRVQAKQEYYEALEKKYKGLYGDYQVEIDDIHFKRNSILSRVRHGQKGLYYYPNLDQLTDAEWEELTLLDIRENDIKEKFQDQFSTRTSISATYYIPNEKTGKAFIDEHRLANKLHTYTDKQGIEHALSVYHGSIPEDKNMIETVLTDEFSKESSEYMVEDFDQTNPSYEQPKEYDEHGKKLYKNDKYDDIKNNDKLFKLYLKFLEFMQEANEMFGYAAISSNYKLPLIYEREASVYIGRGCSVWNSFVYKMKRRYLIDERDFDRSYTSDIHADNTSSGKLRKRFVEMLSDPEHISTDLVYSVMAYYITACRYSDKLDVLAQCELINRKISALDEEKYGAFRTQANSTVDTFLFENTINSSSSAVAIAERLMEHTTVVMLKSKLKTAIKAFLDGYRLLTNVLISNKWNARGHFAFATSKAIRLTFTSLRSSIDTLDYDVSEALMSLNNINILSFADANKTKLTRAYYRSGLMPMLTLIDHVTTKSILLTVYDSIRLYENPDGTKAFLNIEEFIAQYKKHHPELSYKVAEKQATKLFWGEKGNKPVTLFDVYQLGQRDDNGKIIKGTERILNIKKEYRNIFSNDEKENADYWAILQSGVQGQIDEMAAAVNGYKPLDTRSGNFMKKWYLKPIFLIRSFLISNYNELFKHSETLHKMIQDPSRKNTQQYISEGQHSLNKTAEAINRFWQTDNGAIQLINAISSEREMYNTLTRTKDVGYYFGVFSFFRKMLENLIIYGGSKIQKEDPDYRNITRLEKTSVINAFLVCLNGLFFYNAALFVGGLLTCLLGQGSAPDDEDEYFVHWFLWLLYDVCGSLFNDTLVSIPTGDTVEDIFRNFMAMIPAMDQFKQSLLNSDDALTFVSAMFGDDEVFENLDYGSNSNPFNLAKSGKWQDEMYGKRRFYETVQNAPWLIAPWYAMAPAYIASTYLPPIPLANLKESFSAPAAKAKASYTFNNLSPMDYFKLRTPSRSDESYEKFHTYGKWSLGAKMMNDLVGGFEGEEEILDFIRDISKNPYIPVPKISPVDAVERLIPLGRKYE